MPHLTSMWEHFRHVTIILGRRVLLTRVVRTEGLALIEALFSVLLFNLFLLAFAVLVTSSIRVAHVQDVRLRAQHVASNTATKLRMSPNLVVADSETTESIEEDGIFYSVTSSVAVVDDNTLQLDVTVEPENYDLPPVETRAVFSLSGLR